MDLLGIEFIDVGDNFLTVKLTITPQTHQPAGIMHGGVSVVLGGNRRFLFVQSAAGRRAACGGLRHHRAPPAPRARRHGSVPHRLRRKGRTMHYSEMEVSDEQGRLVCAMSMSNMVVAARRVGGKA